MPNSAESATKMILNRKQTALGMEEFFRKILRLHKKKNSDYASQQDGLRNFRETAERLGLSLPQVFLVLIEKHVQALENETRLDELVLAEGVEDRLLDMACYAGLLYLALREKDIIRRRTCSNSQSGPTKD